jgi:hypothetical protein
VIFDVFIFECDGQVFPAKVRMSAGGRVTANVNQGFDLVLLEQPQESAELSVTTFWTFLRELSTAWPASSGDAVTNG